MAANAPYGPYIVKDLHGMVVTVSLSRSLKVRIRLSILMIRFAVWIIGGQTKVETV